VSDELDNPSDEENLLPDERPRKSRYEKSDTTGKEWEKSFLQTNNPFQLQPSTAADSPARRRSRGKQGRDPVCSKYRMAWVLVFFDLPVGSPDERRAANNFRKDLIHDGYMMVQFSVYARPCGTADRVETQVRRLKQKIPNKGEVRGLMISDAQWGRMIIMRSQQNVDAEKMPAQMQFF
jgi:CRISPR-associated protein Cas2